MPASKLCGICWMLKPDLSHDALKFLRGLPPKQSRQIALRIHGLCHDPEPHDSMMLKGALSDYRRVDAGEYRIICIVEGDLLRIALIGKRNDGDVYRRIRRKVK